MSEGAAGVTGPGSGVGCGQVRTVVQEAPLHVRATEAGLGLCLPVGCFPALRVRLLSSAVLYPQGNRPGEGGVVPLPQFSLPLLPDP